MMGKIQPGFRRAAVGSSKSALFKSSTSSATALQEQIPPPITPLQSHKKSPKREPTKSTAPPTKSKAPPIYFKSANLSDAKSLFNSYISSNRNTPSDPSFYNSILQSYSSVSSPQNAIFFLNHMIKAHPTFSPNRFTYDVLLMQSCAVPDEASLANVHNTLNLMKNNGFSPNQVTAFVAVRTLCGCGRQEHAIELVKDLSAQNVLPDTYTYNFLVRHLVKNRSLRTVNCFITDMKNEFGIMPDLVTYTIMIDNACNSKKLGEAIHLLDVLIYQGFTPDCYVYNTIMKGYCRLSRGGVLGVYKKMLEEGVKPDRCTYNTLIYGLSKSGGIKEARNFLGVMAEMGHFPDEVTYTSLMNGMCRQGDVLGALAVLKEMEAKGCVPNSCTYNTLLHGLCKAKLLDKGVELYEVMKKDDIKLETGCYSTFLRELCRNGQVAEAYAVFDYAVESKSLKDFTAYSALESSLKWLRKAREQGLAV